MTNTSLRLNLICYLGVFAGVLSCLLTWSRRLWTGSSETQIISWNAIDAILSEIPIWWNDTVEIACVLFVTGLIISVVSPLGGAVQFVGVALFLANPFPPQVEGWYSRYTTFETGIGSYLAIVSTALVLTSLAIPVWMNLGAERNCRTSRLISLDVRGTPLTEDTELPAQKAKGAMFIAKATVLSSALRSAFAWCRSRKFALRINVLCLLAAAVGLVSLLLPWYVIVMEDHWTQNDYDQPGVMITYSYWLGEFLDSGFDIYSDYSGVAGALMFFIGTVLLLGSPWGAVVQLCGLVAFQQSADVSLITYPEVHLVAAGVHIGFFLGLFSSAIGLISMLEPIGPGYGCEMKTMGVRLTSWGRSLVGREGASRKPG